MSAETSELIEAEEQTPMDLAYLRDLLSLLSEFRVKGFTLDNLAVAFSEAEVDPPLVGRTIEEVVVDENRSTSSRRVRGFDGKNLWEHPSLWPTQAGRPLKFDGSTAG